MTEVIDKLVRRLDAAQCVYELMVMNPGTIRINTYREPFHKTAARIAAGVELETGCDFEIQVVLTTVTRPQHYACLGCGATFLSTDKTVPSCEKCGLPT